jgi:hypothetical protein
MKATKAMVAIVRYVVISCDEMFRIDNQSWLFFHRFVVHNWVRILIFISLDKVFEGSDSDNLIKVKMEMLTTGGGFPRN